MEKKERWTSSKHSVYNLSYHIIWCPKYRRKVLKDNIEIRLKELLIEKAQKLEISIEIMEIMPDHVHIFVKANPILAPHYIVQQLKGYSSRIIRIENPTLKKKLPSLWTRSYYIDSVGQLNAESVKRYIENQKKV